MATLNMVDLMRDLRRSAGQGLCRAGFPGRSWKRAAYPGEQGLPLLGVSTHAQEREPVPVAVRHHHPFKE